MTLMDYDIEEILEPCKIHLAIALQMQKAMKLPEPHHFYLSDLEREKIPAFIEMGMTAAEICELTGRSRMTIERIFERGLPPKVKFVTNEDFEEMKRLNAEGMTRRAIGKQLGYSATTVAQHLRRINTK